MVRYTEEERRSLESLYELRIRTPAGDEVPFANVAEVRCRPRFFRHRAHGRHALSPG